MKIHYTYTKFNRFTACGLVELLQAHVTQDPGEITCKSCLRCFDGYIQRQTKFRESMQHLSNEELLVTVIEKLIVMWQGWHNAREVNDYLVVLLHRLTVAGFITEPEKVDPDLQYC